MKYVPADCVKMWEKLIMVENRYVIFFHNFSKNAWNSNDKIKILKFPLLMKNELKDGKGGFSKVHIKSLKTKCNI